MNEPVYGREALRKFREQQASAQLPQSQLSLLEEIPLDAPMDDATITVWNGERWIAYDKWLAVRPVATEEKPEQKAPETNEGDARKPAPRPQIEQEGLW